MANQESESKEHDANPPATQGEKKKTSESATETHREGSGDTAKDQSIPVWRHKAILEKERKERQELAAKHEALQKEHEAIVGAQQRFRIEKAMQEIGFRLLKDEYLEKLPDEFIVFENGSVDLVQLRAGYEFMKREYPELVMGGTRKGAPDGRRLTEPEDFADEVLK